MTRDIDALCMVWFKRHPSKQARATLHCDQGSQHASQDDFKDARTK